MSVEASGWAWRQPVKGQAERLVLLALADSANGETFECWPSRRYIAARAMCSLATVKRVLASLQEAGLLVIESRFREGAQTSNLYRLPVKSTEVHGDLPPAHSEPPPGSPETLPPAHNSEPQNRNLTINKWGSAQEGIDTQAWEEWAAYKRGQPAQGTITKTVNFLRQYPAEVQRQIVDQSIRSGWKGLFPPKGNNNGNSGRRKTFDEIRAAQTREASGQPPSDDSVVASY